MNEPSSLQAQIQCVASLHTLVRVMDGEAVVYRVTKNNDPPE